MGAGKKKAVKKVKKTKIKKSPRRDSKLEKSSKLGPGQAREKSRLRGR